MKFAVGPTKLWESVGFDTTYWRKSTDEELAIVHAEYGGKLIDLENTPDVRVYEPDTDEFQRLLDERFTAEEEE